MADTTRLIDGNDLGGLWIRGTLLTARPVGTLVQSTADNEIYMSTNAVVATYTQITNSGSPAVSATIVAASPYTVLASDSILLVDVSPCTINLLAIAGANKELAIKDRTGSASGGTPLTINAAGGETIDGEATQQIVVGYGSVTLVPNGTEWSII